MSSSKRISLYQAIGIEQELRSFIEPLCEQYNIAGSIRRQSPTVGDIELVIIPTNAPALYARLDGMVEKGIIRKALYNTQYGPRPRWGQKLRCFKYQGATVELTIADEHNYGYKLWLSTGPADPNHYIMSLLEKHKSPIRFTKGYGWLTSYQNGHPIYGGKLNIPTEESFFSKLNLPFVMPEYRTESFYKSNWRQSMSAHQLADYVVFDPKQRKLL